MSGIGGKAENICSQRVFRILTHSGHPTAWRRHGPQAESANSNMPNSIRAGWSDVVRKGLEISMTHVVTADSLMSADDLNLTLVGRSVAESALLCHSRLGGERP
jgi:hypothetical protein